MSELTLDLEGVGLAGPSRQACPLKMTPLQRQGTCGFLTRPIPPLERSSLEGWGWAEETDLMSGR